MESEEPVSQAAMTDAHKGLLQVLMNRKIMTDVDLDGIFNKICDEYKLGGRTDMQEFIGTINHNLNALYLEIRKGVSEEDGTSYWGLVNTRSDVESRMATSYVYNEIALFKSILDVILEGQVDRPKDASSVGQIRLMDAINLAKDIPSFSQAKAEQAIKKFVQDKWLAQSSEEEDREKRRMISVGVRSLLELKPYLEEVYQGDLCECVVCSETVLRGELCANEKCRTRMHFHCSRRWFQGKATKRCPSCSNNWER